MDSLILKLTFAITFLAAGISTIAFSRMTARGINRKIEASGHFYMCVGDKVGYTLFSMAIAISVPRKLAYKAIPPAFLDVDTVKSLAKKPKDTLLAACHLISTSAFLLFIFLSIFIN